MRDLLIVASAAGLGLGALLVVAGLLGRSVSPDAAGDRSCRSWPAPAARSYRRSALLAIGASGGAWAISGWPALGAIAAGAVIVAGRADAVSRDRRHRHAMAEAVAGWAEMLADVMRSHSALGQAVSDTVASTPDVLRPSVVRLSTAASSGSFERGLADFAASVDDRNADVLVAALGMAHRGRSGNLPEVLDKVAAQTRSRTEMLLRIEAGRARLHSEARAMASITAVLACGIMVLGRPYLDPYDRPIGQAVLAVVGGLFVAGGASLVDLGRPIDRPRTLTVAPRKGRWRR